MADNQLFGEELHGELTDVSVELERIEDLGDAVSRSLGRAFRNAITDGASLKNVLADVGRAFSDIALKAAFKPVETLISGAVENLFAATNPALSGVTPFAKGGVIAAPAYFNLGNSTGLVGEAGPEAILPLARGADGRLGVAATGGQSTTINFNVTASDARSFAAAEAEVSAMLLRAVRRGTRAS